MENRLTVRRFPTRLAASLIGLFAAGAIGGSLGYTLKPATVTTSASHAVVVPQAAAGGSAAGPCVTHQQIRSC